MCTKTMLLLFLCIISNSLNPQILTSSCIVDVHKHSVDQQTLVLFDLDQTVFEVTGHVHEHWFSHMLNHARMLGHDDESALKTVVPLYCNEMSQAPAVIPVEPETVDVIRQLQTRGFSVIGLTARGTELISSTQKQLNNIGVNFDLTKIAPHNLIIPMTRGNAIFEHGILFCGPNNKGDALKALLDAVAYKPTKIVFIDDKEHHLKSVMNMAQQRGIDFVGIRYSHLDAKMHAYVLDAKSKTLLKPPAKKEILHSVPISAISHYTVPNCLILADAGSSVLSVNTVSTIKKLQLSFPMIGITTQSISEVDSILKKINNLDIDFCMSAPTQETISFPLGFPNIFRSGILFCSKMLAVKTLLTHYKLKPTRIVILSNQRDFLEHLSTTIISLGIDCVGIELTSFDNQ